MPFASSNFASGSRPVVFQQIESRFRRQAGDVLSEVGLRVRPLLEHVQIPDDLRAVDAEHRLDEVVERVGQRHRACQSDIEIEREVEAGLRVFVQAEPDRFGLALAPDHQQVAAIRCDAEGRLELRVDSRAEVAREHRFAAEADLVSKPGADRQCEGSVHFGHEPGVRRHVDVGAVEIHLPREAPALRRRREHVARASAAVEAVNDAVDAGAARRHAD